MSRRQGCGLTLFSTNLESELMPEERRRNDRPSVTRRAIVTTEVSICQ